MTDKIQMQVTLTASPEKVFWALTDPTALSAWFAEHADISLAEKRYDFWGRYSPDAPSREEGHHPLLGVESNRRLKYSWKLQDTETIIDLRLEAVGPETVLLLEVTGSAFEDFWFLSLENLRRYLDGKPIVARCDFSLSMKGDIHHQLEIEGPPERVFEALIRPDQLERWFASQATIEPRLGGQYDVGWPQFGPLKILELKPNEKLALGWPEQEQKTTIVTWTLAASGGKTRLTLVHSGFAPDAENGGINTGWLNFMNWIVSLVEYGPAWQPPLIRLPEERRPYYAASIGRNQDKLIA